MEKPFVKMLGLSVFALLLAMLLQCADKAASASDLPKDVLGLSVGMGKEAAQKRLEEVALFERNEERRQQLWRPKNDSHFNYLAVGYDTDNKIRYVTAFADAAVKERIRFSDVGDLAKAKQEILEPHHRYIWEVPARENAPAYSVNIYGDNPNFVTIYSLIKAVAPGEAKTNEEEEDE